MRKRTQRQKLTIEQREKVREYDRNRKKQQLQEVNKQFVPDNDDFKSEARNIIHIGAKCREKSEFLIKCVQEKILKVKENGNFACKLEEGSVNNGVTDGQKDKHFSILQIKAFKKQNRIADHKRHVDELLSHYGSINKAARALKMNYCTLYNLCKPLKKLVHKKVQQKKINQTNLKEFFNLKSTTTTFPKARIANKMFMTSTYNEAYKKYKHWCDTSQIPHISSKTFHRLKPKNVYKLAQIPDNLCTCISCQNFKKAKKCIQEYNIKGIPNHTNEIMLQSMCSVTDADVGVSKEYGKYECISRNCQTCGYKVVNQKKVRSDFFEKQVKKSNPGIYSDKRIIKWQRWEPFTKVTKEGKEMKKIDKFDKFGTRKQFLQVFLQDVHNMALHMFNWKWHDNQFDYLRNNLKPGMLAQVLDFAQNYMNTHVDEPQGCHWDHTQTVIHPIVNFQICPKDGRLITEEHIMISDDMVHDKFAVKKFEDISIDHLKKQGFDPTCILQFCDNCSRQYKSKGPFQYISTSGIPTMRSYFGANHGKGPSDSATGRVKKALNLGRKSRSYELRNAQEDYSFLKSTFEKNAEKCKEENPHKCEHFKQKVFFVTDIDRSDPMVAVTTKTSKKFQTIRSTGNNFIVEARHVACFCGSCIFGQPTECPNKHYCGQWVQYDLRNGKIHKDIVSSHWKNCNIVEESEAIISAENNHVDANEGGVSNINNDHDDTTVSNIDDNYIDFDIQNSPTSDTTKIYDWVDWNDLYNKMQACSNFDQLQKLFEENTIPELSCSPAKLECSHRVDDIA